MPLWRIADCFLWVVVRNNLKGEKARKQHTDVVFGLSRVLLNIFFNVFFKKVKKKLARRMKISIIVFVDDEFEASSKRESLI